MNIEPLIDHSPALIIAVPLLAAFLTPLISMINQKVRNIFVIAMLLLTGFFIYLLTQNVLSNGVTTYVFGAEDITSPVVRILFRIDAFSVFMALIVFILSIVAVLYSWHFVEKNTGQDKYYTLILLMTTGIFGMVLTGDMFNFFVFLEITSISSCALIAYRTDKGLSIDAAFKYIVVSTIGALFFLFAVGIFYGQYNALNMMVIADSITFGFLDIIAFVLIVVSLSMKAGLFPMHMWLPDAYGRAPSSVSLMLIGATQASLYGVFRIIFTVYGGQLNNMLTSFGESPLVFNDIASTFLIILALLTIIIGVLMALKQNDFKRTIAFVALAEMGFIFLAFGAALSAVQLGSEISVAGFTALKGGLFHIINDALDIGLLFLVAGAIYYATKETSLNRLGGLARNMKYTTVFFVIGLLAVSGMPPFNGFASKLMIYQSVYSVNPILAIAAILSSILILAAFVKVFHSVFLGPKIPRFDNVKEAPKSMLIAMAVVASLIIFFGLFPEAILHHIIEPAADALLSFGGV